MSDTIADLLTRIRNAQKAEKAPVEIPFSKMKLSICKVLEDEGYIETTEIAGDAKKTLTVMLKYYEGKPVIENIKRDNLYVSFTPQLYNFTKLFKAYTDIINKKLNVDDEIEAMTKLGYKVKIIKSSPRNIKLTYQDDVKVIKDLMKKI